jgi:hypothetical protein
MIAIPLKTRLKPDGTLDLHVTTGLPEADVEVLVIVQPSSIPEKAWPAGFFEQTYGAFASDPLDIPSGGEFETRENLG